MTYRPAALVTGASRGIGKAIALTLAKSGYDLYLVCHSQKDLLEETCKEARTYNINAYGYILDVGDYTQVLDMYHSIENQHRMPELIVNNAGIAHIGLFTSMEPTQWQNMMNTNFMSVLNICHTFVPSMVENQKGRIINISSVWGNVGASCEAVYSASKGAVNSFTKALAKELAPSHITVNAVACGLIDTDMNQCLSSEDKAALTEEIPACRMGTPEEVAKTVLFLSQGPEYLTGQIMTLDGGWI